MLAFDESDVAVFAASCVAEPEPEPIATPLPLIPTGRLALEADCPATPAEGAPCKDPATWPRPWSCPGTSPGDAAVAVPTPAARATITAATAMRWRFMNAVLLCRHYRPMPRRAGAPRPAPAEDRPTGSSG